MFNLKKNNSKINYFYLCLIYFIGLMFIFKNNYVIAMNNDKNKSKEKEEIKNFFQLNKELGKYSTEENNKIIKILQNPELMKKIYQKVEEQEQSKKKEEKSSSSKS
jgi:hypothetical protein